MEDQPLNLAHQEDRKATRHLQCRRFDEALHCHIQAAKFIENAMTNTCIPRALESLQLQKEYHIRQLQIIRLKKAQLNALKSVIETKLGMMAHSTNKGTGNSQRETEPQNLGTAIFRTMNEADSLFELLVQKAEDIQSKPSQGVTPAESSSLLALQGSKKPKEDHVVIEELHTLNLQLRCFVEQLVTQLGVYEEENRKLKLRIKELENEHKSSSSVDTVEKANRQVIADSSGGNASLFCQLSPELPDKHELLSLAPLEMPRFDYTLVKNSEIQGTFK